MIRVSTSNFYVGNPHPEKDAKLLARFNCDISGIQEGHSGNAIAIRKALHKTHLVWWRKTEGDKGLAFEDVPVVIKRDGIKVLKKWARLISRRSQTENIGMPRAATAIRFIKDGARYTFINVHMNAAVQSRKTRRPLSTRIRRVAQYIKGVIIVEAMIRKAKRHSLVIVVGDLNYRETKHGIWKFSPQAMFRRTGLDYHSTGLDYIAFDKKHLKITRTHKISTRRTGADHPWTIADLDYA